MCNFLQSPPPRFLLVTFRMDFVTLHFLEHFMQYLALTEKYLKQFISLYVNLFLHSVTQSFEPSCTCNMQPACTHLQHSQNYSLVSFSVVLYRKHLLLSDSRLFQSHVNSV